MVQVTIIPTLDIYFNMGVSKVFRGFFKGVSKVFQSHSKSVSIEIRDSSVFYRCYKGVIGLPYQSMFPCTR